MGDASSLRAERPGKVLGKLDHSGYEVFILKILSESGGPVIVSSCCAGEAVV